MAAFRRKKQVGIPTATRNLIDDGDYRYGSPTGEPVNGADRLISSPFTMVVPAPDPQHERAEVSAYVAAALGNNAVDAGNYAFVDKFVLAKLQSWLQLVALEHKQRFDSAAWVVGIRTKNLTVSWGALAVADDSAGALRKRMDEDAAVLTGTEVAAAATEPVSTPAAELLRLLPDLPSATQLAGLALTAPTAQAITGHIEAVASNDAEELPTATLDKKNDN